MTTRTNDMLSPSNESYSSLPIEPDPIQTSSQCGSSNLFPSQLAASALGEASHQQNTTSFSTPQRGKNADHTIYSWVTERSVQPVNEGTFSSLVSKFTGDSGDKRQYEYSFWFTDDESRWRKLKRGSASWLLPTDCHRRIHDELAKIWKEMNNPQSMEYQINVNSVDEAATLLGEKVLTDVIEKLQSEFPGAKLKMRAPQMLKPEETG